MGEIARKITVEISGTLLEKAQLATRSGITQTVRMGLQLLAASQAYKSLRRVRGNLRFSHTAAELKGDRDSPNALTPEHETPEC